MPVVPQALSQLSDFGLVILSKKAIANGFQKYCQENWMDLSNQQNRLKGTTLTNSLKKISLMLAKNFVSAHLEESRLPSGKKMFVPGHVHHGNSSVKFFKILNMDTGPSPGSNYIRRCEMQESSQMTRNKQGIFIYLCLLRYFKE